MATPDADTVYDVVAIDMRGCGSLDSLRVATLPDPIPPPLTAVLRAARAGAQDVRLSWLDMSALRIGTYEVVGLRCGLRLGCGGRVPDPATIQSSPVLAGPVAPGVQSAVHAGAVGAGQMIYYKVRATSPCSGTPGPACDGFPGQVPCP